MKHTLQAAFILHLRPFRETSVIAEGIAEHIGRFSCVARGVRSPRSPLRGLLQPFQPLWIELGGRGELKTLFQAEARDRSFYFSGKKLFCALYLNELVFKTLAREDSHDDIFKLYQKTLTDLASEEANLDMILRYFEMTLLQLLGFGLTLDRLAGKNTDVEAEKYYLFRPGEGVYDAEHSIESDGFWGWELIAITHHDFSDPRVAKSARRLLQTAIAHVTTHRPIQSRMIFRGGKRHDYSRHPTGGEH